MKINKLKLFKYGKFNDKEIEFKDGLNIVVGQNESGKSTVCTALKTLLYPLVKVLKSKTDKIKYIPLDAKCGMLSMDFSLNDNREFSTTLSLGSTPKSTRKEILEQPLLKEVITQKTVGEYFLNVSEDFFDSVAYIKNIQSLSDIKNNSEIINNYLSVILKDEPIDNDFDESLTKLDKAIKNYTSKQKKNAIIPSLELERAKLMQEYDFLNVKLEEEKQKRQDLKAKNNTVIIYNNKLQEILIKIDKVQEYTEYKKLLNTREIIAKNQKIKDEIKNLKQELEKENKFNLINEEIIGDLRNKSTKISELKSEISKTSCKEKINELENQTKKYNILYLGFMTASVISLLGVLLNPYLLLLTFALVSGTIINIIKTKKLKKELITVKNDEKEFEKTLNNYIYLENEFNKELTKYGVDDLFSLSDGYNRYKELKFKLNNLENNLEENEKYFNSNINIEEYAILIEKFKNKEPELQTENINDLQNSKDNLNYKINELQIETAKLSAELNLKSYDIKRLEVKESLDRINEEIRINKEKANDLTAVYSLILKAKENFRKEYSPSLKNKFIEVFNEISGKHYSEMRLTEAFNISTIEEGDSFIKTELTLSSGTLDQLYIALRLAVYFMVFEGKEPSPILLDDAFLELDDERFGKLISYLGKLKGIQIIYFTCIDRLKACDKNYFNIINL